MIGITKQALLTKMPTHFMAILQLDKQKFPVNCMVVFLLLENAACCQIYCQVL